LWVLLATAVALFVGGPALAQGIPDAIRTKTTELTADEETLVKQYVEDHSKNLMKGDQPELIKKDRDALLEPLSKKDTGVPFRIKYSQFLIEKLRAMTAVQITGTDKEKGAAEKVVLNGVIIAGELATDQAIDLITDKAGAKEPAVRYQVGYALQRVFRASQNPPAAAQVTKLVDAIKGLSDRIAEEKDAQVLDSLIRAGLEGAKINQDAAISAVAKGAAKAAKNLNNPGGVDEARALLRAADNLQLMIATANGGGSAVGLQSAKDAAELGGMLIARVVRMVEKKELPQAEAKAGDLRDTCAQIVSAAQKLVQFAGQAMNSTGSYVITDKNGRAIQLNELLRRGTTNDDAVFVEDAQLMIGPDGMLTKDPFKFPADSFR
jgi:hypothetical protein